MLMACNCRLRMSRLCCNIMRLKIANSINKSYLRNRFWTFVTIAMETSINSTKSMMFTIWDKKQGKRVITVELEQTNLNFNTPIRRWQMAKKKISLKETKGKTTANNNRLMLNWVLLRWLLKKKRQQRQQLITFDIRKSMKMKRSWHTTITT